MKRRLIAVIKGEKGQALPIVLVLMLLGGLLIAPSLSYASTSLNAGRVVEKNVNGLYAADAGVEYALWHIVHDIEMPKKKKEEEKLNVNQLEVEVEVDPKIDGKEKKGEEKGTYTIYYGELEETGPHYDWLDIGGEMVWNEPEEAYQYTIRVTRTLEADGNISLEEIGVRLPVGYEYETGTAASFFGGELFSTDEPFEEKQDQADAYMYKWEFDTTANQDDPPATQTFYVTGEEGEPEGDYTWVEALSSDIGKVGETAGKMYTIEATAKVPEKHGEEIAIVKACVLREEVEEEAVIHIISWQITHTKEKKGK